MYVALNKRLWLYPLSFGIVSDCVETRQNIVGTPLPLDFEQLVTAVAVTSPLP